MKRRRRGAAEEMSIAFLDVVTCGFGAIILLLMIAKIGVPVVLEPTPSTDPGLVKRLQEELFEIRGEATVLNRDLNARQEQLSEWTQRVAKLKSRLASLSAQQENLSDQSAVNALVKGELEDALQNLTEEMQRLLAQRSTSSNELVGGIPVDSEYIIFIIDTSGSMFQFSWNKMINQMVTILDTYPNVKGIQILNDMGQYMFSSYRGRWIPDTPGRRRTILQRIRTWNPFSNSSPVEGIQQAIRTYYSAGKKISLYVLGDEFTGNSIKQVVDTVDRINRVGADGQRLVRI
ncbi:MAG: VWA domain-containing protein, partial [Gammaproteobacteria bacterium]|nr:VWA domain-containing protein [Gammaproteobacteria bacterium]